MDFSGFGADQTIDLTVVTGTSTGIYSNIGGLTGNMSLAVGTLIENAVGGSGNDDISMGDGNDFASGDDGDDTIDGGAGDDNVQGGEGADSLTGGSGADTLGGGNGDDTLIGGTGDDLMNGGAGDDLFILNDLRNLVQHGLTFTLIQFRLDHWKQFIDTCIRKAAKVPTAQFLFLVGRCNQESHRVFCIESSRAPAEQVHIVFIFTKFWPVVAYRHRIKLCL